VPASIPHGPDAADDDRLYDVVVDVLTMKALGYQFVEVDTAGTQTFTRHYRRYSRRIELIEFSETVRIARTGEILEASTSMF
jgi:hypothetical protein